MPGSYRFNGTATDPAKNKSLPKRKRLQDRQIGDARRVHRSADGTALAAAHWC